MPDFVATLAAVAVFCFGLKALNALTRAAEQVVPLGLAESGLTQYGLALLMAGLFWRRSLSSRPTVAGQRPATPPPPSSRAASN